MELRERVENLDSCAYAAYVKFRGRPLAKEWKELSEEQKNSWRYIATAVLCEAEEIRNTHEARKRLRLFSVTPNCDFVLDYIDK